MITGCCLQCGPSKMDAPMDKCKFFIKDLSEIKKIARELQRIGCCRYCVFRFLGEKQVLLYRKSEKETVFEVVGKLCCLDGEDINVMDADTNGEGPCVSCLDILKEYCSDEFCQKIVNRVQQSKFEFINYYCSLMLPVSLIVRQHSIYIYLRENFKSLYYGVVEEDIPAVKEVWKWQNGPTLCDTLGAPFHQKSPFEINITFTYSDSNKECNFLTDIHPNIFRKRKCRKSDWEMFTRTNVAKAVSITVDSVFKKACVCPLPKPNVSSKCEQIKCQHDSIFLAGRYNKYTRTLSQTPWLVEGVRKMDSSVQEIICTLLTENFQSSESKFSASGREDVDVKMLGTGRPFVVELVNPHKVKFSPCDMAAMQKTINANKAGVYVRDLQFVSREEIINLKEGEAEKTKKYRALCWCLEPPLQDQLDQLNSLKNLTILQKTPVRVLHRRPLATREKTILNLHAEKIDDDHFELNLQTQAGTYIKEFIHSDFGRTTPNISILLKTECDILELDVMSVDVDWPPKLDEHFALE